MKIHISLVLILLAVHLLILSNLGFTFWPEILSYPYLLNNGFTLYKDYVHPYPPILTVALSYLFKFFGYNQWAVKVFTWSLILVSDIGIVLLVKKLTKSLKLAVLSLVVFVVTQPFFEGNMLWFDLAIVPSVIFGLYFSLERKFLLSGIFFAIAALTKQTAGMFLIIAFICMYFDKARLKEYTDFFVGPLVLATVFLMKLLIEGTAVDAFNWMLLYPFTFWSKFPGYVNFDLSGRDIFNLFIIFVLPLVYFVLNTRLVLKFPMTRLIWLAYLASFLIVYPRFSFFHLQLAIALNAILFASIANNNGLNLFRYRFLVTKPFIAIWVIAVFILGVIYSQQADRFNGKNRFWSEGDYKIANEIQAVTGEGSILFLGLPSTLYIFNNSLPPKPWADNFGWYYEVPGFQEKVIQSWEVTPPKYIVTSKSGAGSWYELGVYKPKKIVGWIEKNYDSKSTLNDNLVIWVNNKL